MPEQTISIILSGLILLVNASLFFLFKDIKVDIRDLRQNYVSALEKVAVLTVEVFQLKATIEILRSEIQYLKNKKYIFKENQN